MNFLALLLGDRVWRLSTWFVRCALRLRGVKFGKNLYAEGFPVLKLDGPAANIEIGDNVKLLADMELRNRENGKIRIGNGCKIDRGVRLLAANDAVLSIGNETNISPYCQFNCGADVTIGTKCLIGAFAQVQSSSHGTRLGACIKDQPHEYGRIAIGDDVWLGSHVSVLPGVSIGSGAVIGSKAVVTGDIEPNAIAVGVPAKTIRFRESVR